MKYEIMLAMLLQLLRRDSVTAEEFAERFEISKRSVYRYVDALGAAHVPIMTRQGRNGGISISDGFKLHSMYFTPEEFDLLIKSVLAYRATGNEQTADSALTKLQSTLPQKQQGDYLDADTLIIDNSGWSDLDSHSNKLHVIEQAILEKRLLDIEYHAADSTVTSRTIEPHLLLLKQGMWYSYAFCRLKDGFRLFKLSRIAKLQLSSASFERRQIDKGKLNFAELLPTQPSVNVVLELSESVRTEVEEWLSIENVSLSQSGRLTASANLPDDHTLVSKILSFGGSVRVISPPALSQRVLLGAAKIAKLYEQSKSKD